MSIENDVQEIKTALVGVPGTEATGVVGDVKAIRAELATVKGVAYEARTTAENAQEIAQKVDRRVWRSMVAVVGGTIAGGIATVIESVRRGWV